VEVFSFLLLMEERGDLLLSGEGGVRLFLVKLACYPPQYLSGLPLILGEVLSTF
jgi:hypothetical protein